MTKKSSAKYVKSVFVAIFTSLALISCKSVQTQETAQQENDEIDTVNTQQYEGVIVNTPIDEIAVTEKKNPYDTLNVATYIMKADDTYFIADCYHDQIIYNDNLDDAISEWSVLTDEVHYAHTIATDGVLLVVDDTENNRLLAFQRTEQGYVHTQTLENIGTKPHFVRYDEESQSFMAWSSITGEMYMLKRTENADENGVYPLYVDKVLKLDELYGVYVRSFTVIGEDIYFVSGHNNQKIIQATINGDSFEVKAEYSVPNTLAGMVQLYKIQDYFYITVSTDSEENQDYATIIRTAELEALSRGEYEDIYAKLGISGGTPYYINEIDGRYYMAHHRTSENIIAFDVVENEIENVEVIY